MHAAYAGYTGSNRCWDDGDCSFARTQDVHSRRGRRGVILGATRHRVFLHQEEDEKKFKTCTPSLAAATTFLNAIVSLTRITKIGVCVYVCTHGRSPFPAWNTLTPSVERGDGECDTSRKALGSCRRTERDERMVAAGSHKVPQSRSPTTAIAPVSPTNASSLSACRRPFQDV